MPLLHPDVAVVLSYPSLGIQEGKADASLGTEPRVVAATVLNCFFVELVPESAKRDRAHSENDCAAPFNKSRKRGGEVGLKIEEQKNFAWTDANVGDTRH